VHEARKLVWRGAREEAREPVARWRGSRGEVAKKRRARGSGEIDGDDGVGVGVLASTSGDVAALAARHAMAALMATTVEAA